MAAITPTRFAQLKEKITAECLKRSKIGDAPGSQSLSQYATSAYNFSYVPETDNAIKAEHLAKSWDILHVVNSDRIPEKKNKVILNTDVRLMEDLIFQMSNNPESANTGTPQYYPANYSDCSGGCTGLCFGCTGCTSGCKNECTGCTGCTSCTGSCTNGCTGSCEGSCTGGCKESCSGLCTSGCKNECTGGCLGCSGGCRGYCIGTASKGYSSCGACDVGCYGGCCSDCSSNCGSHINIPTTSWQAHNNQIMGCIKPGWRPDWWDGKYT